MGTPSASACHTARKLMAVVSCPFAGSDRTTCPAILSIQKLAVVSAGPVSLPSDRWIRTLAVEMAESGRSESDRHVTLFVSPPGGQYRLPVVPVTVAGCQVRPLSVENSTAAVHRSLSASVATN